MGTNGTDREVLKAEVDEASGACAYQRLVREIPISDHVLSFAVRLARATRPDDPAAPDYIRELVTWGAGPRATQCLALGGKAAAAMRGAPCVSIEDVQALAKPVLRHRIIPSFAAEADSITPDDIVARLLEDVKE